MDTVTGLNQAIAVLINQAELPFDAKVFVIRSIHSEMEMKYNEYLAMIKRTKEQAKVQEEKEETKTEQGGN